MMQPCPCGSGETLEECCAPIIRDQSAPTAEALMRSRYTAYVLREEQYLMDTWHPDKRPRTLMLDDQQRWLGLRIKRTEDGQSGDDAGLVEFVARYKIAGRGFRLHEVSHFVRIKGKWLYVEGDFPEN